jgi:PAS domain S-box-containing protein
MLSAVHTDHDYNGIAPGSVKGLLVMPGFEDPPRPAATRPREQTRLARRLFLGTVITSGALVLCWSAVTIVSSPPGVLWVVLAVLTALSAAAAFRMPGFPVSFSLADTFTIMAALLFGPAAGAVLVAVDGLVLSWRMRISKPTIGRVVFNVTSLALAMWLSASLFFLISGHGPLAIQPASPGTVLPLAVFATVYFLLNTGLVAGAAAIGREVSFYRVWREHFLPLWLTHFAGTSIAGLLLIMMAAGLANLSTLTIGLPMVVLLLVAFLNGAERVRQRSDQFAKLRSYAAALRSTGDGVLLTNVDDRVTFMNPVAERLTGWTNALANGRHIDDVLRLAPIESNDEPPAVVTGHETEISTREFELTRQDGRTFPIEQTFAYIRDEDGDIDGVIRTFRDISQRKAVEAERQALLRRQEEAHAAAEAANRSKDEFLATLSHELRTPMTAIMGWVHLLKSGRMDSERTRQALASLERGARAQATVVNDLLDISRIIRGNLRLEVRRTSLPEILKEAAETVEQAIQAKNINLRLNVADDVSILDGDPDRLRQVFWNLLSNSVKFTPAGGSIEMVARREGAVVHVEVTDTGSGIDPAFLPFIFERFRQADGSSTRGHGGLGLGLAIVRQLVELHGGTVEAKSEGPGRGAQFHVRLPAVVRRRENDLPVASGKTV